jgi:hypothetical protein
MERIQRPRFSFREVGFGVLREGPFSSGLSKNRRAFESGELYLGIDSLLRRIFPSNMKGGHE